MHFYAWICLHCYFDLALLFRLNLVFHDLTQLTLFIKECEHDWDDGRSENLWVRNHTSKGVI